MHISLSDLAQDSTNYVQASNAYSRGRSAVSQGNTQIAKLSLSELQFTYNNAKNAGNDSEAQRILNLINMLNAAMNPAASPIAPSDAPSSFTIDMSTTKAPSSSLIPSWLAPPSTPDTPPAARSDAPNYVLWGGVALGLMTLVGGGVYLATRGAGEKKS